MGIDHLAGQSVGLDGVAELVGEGLPVPVNGVQVQLVFSFEYGGIAMAQQEIEQKTQVKMCVIGQKQGVAPDHLRHIPGNPGLGKAPFPEILGGDAGELLDFWRHKATGGKGDQLVVGLDNLGDAIHPLHHHGGKFDDLIPGEEQAGGLGIKEDQTVIFGKKGIKHDIHLVQAPGPGGICCAFEVSDRIWPPVPGQRR